ncbi:MAG: DctP family TRAP transporter solute-binding subunit [Peptoniphilus sp.]|uniref:TRAP-T family tripartite ATP-independent periplasmic transporter n=2 Tax=Peptoniphilus indolicus TaxID=33030 RepID=G4D2Z7_9FIRM|nr:MULTISPECIES: DctP family TRAP transporter solute-binding subunit [Peptoniphilus]EGY80099.1 TRAP-T family tripartite ATP-independent periplasmic transporter [Peptoniphilus indolicus ATCC 29427]MDY2987518.1 DctP family TRAP transporter solute-binding subunit [Peptoniphilus sp.]SUB75138.1 Extracytoplasmic solute receptor protein yiaO [Peptoniphilus indolicus]
MKKTLIGIILLGLLLMTACGSNDKQKTETKASNTSTTEVKGDKVEIKIAVTGNEEHQSTIAANLFKEKLESSSEDFIVNIYPNSQLGGEREAAEGVKLGTIPMTIVTSDGTLPAWVPKIQVLTIPYLFENSEQAYKALDGIITEKLDPEFEAAGFKHLAYGELGFRHFTNSKLEISNPEDLKGLSIRVQEAPIWFELMKSLNASAVPVAFNELYTALQQGMVDGQENPVASIATMKFNEVQKYLSLDGHTYGAISYVMNKDFFDKLTPEQQENIKTAAKESAIEQRKIVADNEAKYLDDLKSTGMIVTEVNKDAFKEVTKDIYEQDEVAKMVDPKFVDEVRDFIK